MFNISKNALLISVAILSACSFSTDNLRDEAPVAKPTSQKPVNETLAEKADVAADEGYTYTPQTYQSDNENKGEFKQNLESGTFVGQKIAALKSELNDITGRTNNRPLELEGIRGKISEDARKYHELVALINSRLQVGTTPGNPILNEKWHQAGIQLDAISSDVGLLNGVLAGLTADSGMVTYVLDSVKAAFNISGAVDEDHNQLKVLENEAVQTSVQIERMFNEINLDINRQQQYLAIEKRNLTALAMAIRDGQLYSTNPIQTGYNQQMLGSVVSSTVANRETVEQVKDRKPLVSIRFDKRNVAYEQALYQAVKRALERKSDVEFDIIGITPASGSVAGIDARRSADAVYKSLINMGVPANRIKTAGITSSETKSVEVKVYVK